MRAAVSGQTGGKRTSKVSLDGSTSSNKLSVELREAVSGLPGGSDKKGRRSEDKKRASKEDKRLSGKESILIVGPRGSADLGCLVLAWFIWLLVLFGGIERASRGSATGKEAL